MFHSKKPGSLFSVQSVNQDSIPATSSGVLLTATAGPGEYLKLNTLFANGSAEPHIRLVVDGNELFSGDLVDSTPEAGDWGVSSSYAGAGTIGSPERTMLREVVGKQITVEKTLGGTQNTIFYSYEVGVML